MKFDQPLTFSPMLQSRIWGGRKLHDHFGKRLPDNQLYGESWEVCDRPEAQSTVADGPHTGLTLNDLWTLHRRSVFGPKSLTSSAEHFPILIKILDATAALSLQVHPPLHAAFDLHGQCKTEWWYVVDAEPTSQIFAGLKHGVTRNDFEHHLARGDLETCVHELHPMPGDHLLLPSGRLHAIGAGLLIFEVQQNSDTTYRVFDWNRLDSSGQARQLHIAESLQCIDFDDFEPDLNRHGSGPDLVTCQHFEVQKSALARGQTWTPTKHTGVILAVVSGHLGTYQPGAFILMPADIAEKSLPTAGSNGTVLLEITLP